jgi:hypothetical protein
LVAPEKFCIIFKTKKSKIWRKLLELWSVTHIQTHRQSDMGFFSAYAIISFGLRARNNLHYLFLQTCLNWKKFFKLKTKGFFYLYSFFYFFFYFLRQSGTHSRWRAWVCFLASTFFSAWCCLVSCLWLLGWTWTVFIGLALLAGIKFLHFDPII